MKDSYTDTNITSMSDHCKLLLLIQYKPKPWVKDVMSWVAVLLPLNAEYQEYTSSSVTGALERDKMKIKQDRDIKIAHRI